MNNSCSTHRDWNPARVDLLSKAQIGRLFSVPAAEIETWVAFDPAFPNYRRNLRGERVWRLPDLNEYLDGAR